MKTTLTILLLTFTLGVAGQVDSMTVDVYYNLNNDVQVMPLQVLSEWGFQEMNTKEAITALFAEYYEWCQDNPDTVGWAYQYGYDHAVSQYVYNTRYYSNYDGEKVHSFRSAVNKMDMPITEPHTPTFEGFVIWCYERRER